MASTEQEVHERLRAAYGAPAKSGESRSPFEALVAAVLAQQSTPSKVAFTLQRLRDADTLLPSEMLAVDSDELVELIRPAGHAAAKARRLRQLLRHVAEQRDGSFDALLSQSRHALREELSAINGVGPETVDRISLYAAGLPGLPIESATHRVWKRHGWIEAEADYFSLQEQIERGLPPDAVLFQELHALLALVGGEFCRTQPLCEGCPLAPLLPEGGPLEPL